MNAVCVACVRATVVVVVVVVVVVCISHIVTLANVYLDNALTSTLVTLPRTPGRANVCL